MWAMADGSAYIQGEGSILWYVSGQRMTKVKSLDYSLDELFAMADGSAVVNCNGILWRLKGTEASRITEGGIEVSTKATKEGFLFNQWQKEIGMTDSDRAIYDQELEEQRNDDARGYEDR
jgi:hypothetical protein